MPSFIWGSHVCRLLQEVEVVIEDVRSGGPSHHGIGNIDSEQNARRVGWFGVPGDGTIILLLLLVELVLLLSLLKTLFILLSILLLIPFQQTPHLQ